MAWTSNLDGLDYDDALWNGYGTNSLNSVGGIPTDEVFADTEAVPYAPSSQYESRTTSPLADTFGTGIEGLAPGSTANPIAGSMDQPEVDIEMPFVAGMNIDSSSEEDSSFGLRVPYQVKANDLLVACIMTRSESAPLVAPAGWLINGTYLGNMTWEDGGTNHVQTVTVFTKIATATEYGTRPVWTTGGTPDRMCGLIACVRGNFGVASIESVTESYGNGTLADIDTVDDRLNLTVATWLYTDSIETYRQTGNNVQLITDSPSRSGRISGGYSYGVGTVESYHSNTSTNDSPNHGMINIIITAPDSGSGGGGGPVRPISGLIYPRGVC